MSNVVWIDFAGAWRRILTKEYEAEAMADPGFETDLERLFDHVDPAPDAATFARAVDARLDRLIRVRRWVYGLFGGVGALVASLQLAQWDVLGGLDRARRSAAIDLNNLQAVDVTPFVTPTLLWAALVLVTVGVYVTRLFQEE